MSLTANAEAYRHPPDPRTVLLSFLALFIILIFCTDLHPPKAPKRRHVPTRNFLRAHFTASSNSVSPSSSTLQHSCGPPPLAGHISLGNTLGNWLPWSQIRKGTTCRHVRFRTPFTNKHDIRVFLTADRTHCRRDSHLSSVVWAERISSEGFEACIHLSSDSDQDAGYWKEKVQIASWAVDVECTQMERRYLGRVITRLKEKGSSCIALPVEADADSYTVLTMNLRGVEYKHDDSNGGRGDTEGESVMTWLEERGDGSFMACWKRLCGQNAESVDGAGLDMIAIRRNNQLTGLSKIKLGDHGRECVFVHVDLTKVGNADDEAQELPIVFVQAGLQVNDTVSNSPKVVAWVDRRMARGFTVCAKNLNRDGRRPRHSIQVHWIAIGRVGKGMD